MGASAASADLSLPISASTGEELWRFHTVPRKGEPGADTWGNFNTDWGGGATWMSGTYDPQLNLIYWPTGNPWPDYYAGERRGDNLYTCAVVALDATTGKLKWHFQFTPGDFHDWDAQSIPVLIDAEYKGGSASCCCIRIATGSSTYWTARMASS